MLNVMDIEVTVLDGRDDNPFLEAILSNRAKSEPTPAERAKTKLDDLLKPEDYSEVEPISDIESEYHVVESREIFMLPTPPEESNEIKCRRAIKRISTTMNDVRRKGTDAAKVREVLFEVLPLLEQYQDEHLGMLKGILILPTRPRDIAKSCIKDVVLSKSIGNAFKTYDRFEERVAVVLAFMPFLGPYDESQGHQWVKPRAVKLK